MCVWNDASIDWADFDLTVIRSTWDYTRDRDGVPDVGRERSTDCSNPYPIIEYSTDKHYLGDLERAVASHRAVDVL